MAHFNYQCGNGGYTVPKLYQRIPAKTLANQLNRWIDSRNSNAIYPRQNYWKLQEVKLQLGNMI